MNRGCPPRDELKAFSWTESASEMRLWACLKDVWTSVFPQCGSICVTHLKTRATGSKHAQEFFSSSSRCPSFSNVKLWPYPHNGATSSHIFSFPSWSSGKETGRWDGRQSDRSVPISQPARQMPPATKETALHATRQSSVKAPACARAHAVARLPHNLVSGAGMCIEELQVCPNCPNLTASSVKQQHSHKHSAGWRNCPATASFR